jgi:hypothetical protein
VEDQFPSGWAITNIDQGGQLDPVHGKVKWGPYLDGAPRALTYLITPPVSAQGVVAFQGTASFDGLDVPVTGARQSRPASRLTVGSRLRPDRFSMTLDGEQRASYFIEISSDLLTWVPLTRLTNDLGQLEFSEPVQTNQLQRFYRARLVE